MKTVLILTASTGGGHNQAAFALEKKFALKGYHVQVVDFIKLNSKIIEILFIDSYTLLYSHLPRVYSGLYKLSNHRGNNVSLIKYITKVFEKNIYKLLMDSNPDLIIGTHPFIVEVICKIKQKRKITLPFISIITDFKAHNLYINHTVDAYITGSPYTSRELINKGIEKHKIFHYGIPLRQEFFSHPSIMKKDDYPFTILLMGGSLGSAAIEKVLMALITNENTLKIFVVCGNNRILAGKIQNNYKDKYKNKDIIIYGFTEDIPILMEQSDILISKPGGLTTTEAITKKLPMMIPYMIPGQEEENAEFLVESGAAILVDDIKNLSAEINNLIDCPYMLSSMRRNMEILSQSYSVDAIIDLGKNLIEKYEHGYKQMEA